MEGPRRIALLGGAFDPPTGNHLLGATEVVHSGAADEVWLVPCGPRPDKPKLSPVLHRYVMTQISVNTAFSPDMPVRVCDLEVHEKEALATYDLLRALREKYPQTEFSFVIGTDWLQPGADLRQWTSKEPGTGRDIVTGDKLVSEFDFLVIHRPGYSVEDLSAFGPRMKYLEMPKGIHLMEGSLSSTEVRKRTDVSYRVQNSTQLIEGLVTPSCHGYITRHRLYMTPTETSREMVPRRTTLRGASMDDALGDKRNVAVYSGAFDPPTFSHMICLAEIIHSGIADEVLMIPYGRKKGGSSLREPLVRYLMCQLAVSCSFSPSMPVNASTIEVHEPEQMGSYDLLCKLQAERPDCNFVLIVGSDWLQTHANLKTWTSKDPKTGEMVVTGEKLLSEFDIIVIQRPGYPIENLESFGPRIKTMEMPHGLKRIDTNMSSTEVRTRAEKGLQLLDGILPVGVFNFIKREGIYKPEDFVRTMTGK